FTEEIVGSVSAVDHQAVVVALLSAEADGAAEAGSDLRGWSQLCEVAIVAARERKFLKAGGIENLRNSRSGGVDDADGVGSDDDAGFGGFDLHVGVERERGADGDLDLFDGVSVERSRLEGNGVFARSQSLKIIGAIYVAGELAFEASG